jgi:hypothetical protein
MAKPCSLLSSNSHSEIKVETISVLTHHTPKLIPVTARKKVQKHFEDPSYYWPVTVIYLSTPWTTVI